MSFYERAVKVDKEAKDNTRANLLKKYWYIDLSRFKILTHIDNDARVHIEVLFIDLSIGASHEVDQKIEGDEKSKFWDNEKFTQYLYLNRPIISTAVEWPKVYLDASQGQEAWALLHVTATTFKSVNSQSWEVEW